MSDIGKIDPNLAVSGTIGDTQVLFYNVRRSPFRVYGLLPAVDGEPWRRIPEALANQVNPGVKELHTRTAGGRVRFRTDSDRIAIRATKDSSGLMPHMPFVGSDGYDLYSLEEGNWRYCGSFKAPVNTADTYESILNLDGRKMRELMIHFPLYSGVRELLVGVIPGAQVLPGGSYRLEKPVVYYGSSITQGGCASRPGNGYSNMISRKLNIDHINLGFSGNARGELILADYIAGLPMSVFFMDYDHNAPDPDWLAATHEPFFLRIRQAQPELPIILASQTDCVMTAVHGENIEKRRQVVLKTYHNALARGDKNVYFVDGREVFKRAEKLGMGPEACTVDGCHPNDLGFACMAEAFGEVIEKVL